MGAPKFFLVWINVDFWVRCQKVHFLNFSWVWLKTIEKQFEIRFVANFSGNEVPRYILIGFQEPYVNRFGLNFIQRPKIIYRGQFVPIKGEYRTIRKLQKYQKTTLDCLSRKYQCLCNLSAANDPLVYPKQRTMGQKSPKSRKTYIYHII